MAISAFSFGANAAKIAAWQNPSNWGTTIDLQAVRMIVVNFQTVNGILEGDDIISDTHAKIISVQLRLQFAFKDLDVWNVLTGQAVVDSSPTSESMVIGGVNMPYFGLSGKALHTSGGGDVHIFVPKCKILEGLSYGMEYGAYHTPEVQATGIVDSALYGAFRVIQHATEASLTLPPT